MKKAFEIELRNRFLKIGQEYGTPAGEAVKGLHRHDVGIKHGNDGINDCINFSGAEEKAIKLILRTPSITAMELAGALGLKKRQGERIIASLKKKAGLVREGSRKSGIWRFPQKEFRFN